MSVSPSNMSFLGFISFLTTTGKVKDVATGQILGAGIGKASDSFVKDFIAPLITFVTNGATLDQHFIVLRPGISHKNKKATKYATVAEAEADHAVIIKYGETFYAIFNLLVQALVVYLIIGAWKRCIGDSCAWKRK